MALFTFTGKTFGQLNLFLNSACEDTRTHIAVAAHVAACVLTRSAEE